MKYSLIISIKSLGVSALLILGLGLLLPVRADLNSDLAFTAFSNVDVKQPGRRHGAPVARRSAQLPARHHLAISLHHRRATGRSSKQADPLESGQPFRAEGLASSFRSSSRSLAPPTSPSWAACPDNSSMQFQIDSTAKLDPENPSLQVSKQEAQLIAATAAQEKDPKALFVQGLESNSRRTHHGLPQRPRRN